MNYSAIKYYDIANGTGVRTTLFVSGCRNHCKGCFQPETWDFNHGEPFTKEIEDEIIESLKNPVVDGLTLLGGDPFEEENQAALVPFLERAKAEAPNANVWAFTGYVLDEDLVKGGRKYTEDTEKLLSFVDILVDGPFIEEKRNLCLKFKGSENQRLINMKHWRETGEIICVD